MTATTGAPAVTVEELAAQVAQLTTLVGEFGQAIGERAAAAGGAAARPVYSTVEEWVRDWLLVNYTRPMGEVGGRWSWCEQWWAHNEAVVRLTALWYGWEHARLEQTGMLGWLREADYHLQVLCAADGPLRDCAPAGPDASAKHRGDEFAPVVDAPAGWFDWWREEEE